MSDIYNEFTSQETTASLLDSNRVVNFSYDDTAFNNNETAGREIYNFNAHNNIPLSTGLSTPTQTLGFGGRSGVFKRLFWNHTVGRISYNLNKVVQALRSILGSFKSDYSENISEYSAYAVYKKGDVCFRLNGNTITFYRCRQTLPFPGPFNGVYWEKPEEELSHDRPAVGVPVPWFEKVPEWAIRFDNGETYSWIDVPALNFDDFKALVTLTEDGFTVPDFTGKVPMFTGGNNAVKSGYNGENFTACVQSHNHDSKTVTFTLKATNISHKHDNAESTLTGTHQHEITSRCDYDGTSNRTMLPVDDIDRYNPATLTNYGGSHKHESSKGTATCSSAVSGAHAHVVTISGQTGGVKGATGGNPDSFQCCWIVRYK